MSRASKAHASQDIMMMLSILPDEALLTDEYTSSVQELFLLHQALHPEFLSNQQLLRNGVSDHPKSPILRSAVTKIIILNLYHLFCCTSTAI